MTLPEYVSVELQLEAERLANFMNWYRARQTERPEEFPASMDGLDWCDYYHDFLMEVDGCQNKG